MITAITLENFKGVREPVRIELAPLTLLFGPNNAGKSTIIQALIYAREIFERGDTDPRHTVMGGDTLDLGGFDSLVQGRDMSLTDDGFELKQTRTPIVGDQLPDVLTKWQGRVEGDNSWTVPPTDIVTKGYDLLSKNPKKVDGYGHRPALKLVQSIQTKQARFGKVGIAKKAMATNQDFPTRQPEDVLHVPRGSSLPECAPIDDSLAAMLLVKLGSAQADRSRLRAAIFRKAFSREL